MENRLYDRLGSVVSRRSFVKGAGVGTLAVMSGLLAACEATDDDDEIDDDAPVADPDDDEVDDEEPVDDDPADDTEPADDDDDEAVDDDERHGGALNVALVGEPPTLDIHQTTADIVAFITWHIYEPLFTWDEDYEILPELAESHEVSEDGLTQTVQIREGITFHNDEEMTTEDVIASFERWANMSPLGGDLREVTDDVEATDEYTIEFRLSEPFGAFATLMSRQSQGFAVYPASVVEESTETELSDYIGTGPYRFVEHAPDQHILVERYDGYTQRSDEPNGYGGHKYQYLDEIYFIPVPDEAARAAGLQAGDYDYLQDVSPDQFGVLDDDPDIVAETLPPQAWAVLVLNTAEGLMADQTLRQAVLAALNHEEIAQAAYGEGFYELDPAIMHQETAWHSTVGEEFYNQNDPDRAAELMEEAGYDGTPIRLATTQEYSYMYNSAAVAEQQLVDAGFEVDLEVFDWATLVEVRADPGEWDIFTTGSTFRVDPVMQPYIASTDWPGWWDSDEKVELAQELLSESDFDRRFEVFEELQRLFYEEVPMIKVADELSFNARRAHLQGFTGQVQLGAAFWNIWLED